MKHIKLWLFALVMLLPFTLPVQAQVTTNVIDFEVGDGITAIGTLYLSEDGDIIFTDLAGNAYILIIEEDAPSIDITTIDLSAYYAINGTVINAGSEDWPVIIYIDADGSLQEYIVDEDTDGDGVFDVYDNCPDDSNAEQIDGDDDGIGDVCDRFFAFDDGDNDGIPDASDICPLVFNPIAPGNSEQAYVVDTDDDAEADACVEEVDDDMDDEDTDDNDDTEDVDDIDDDEVDERIDIALGGFYCRNVDVYHPKGIRIATDYNVDYEDILKLFCNDNMGWGQIRQFVALEYGVDRNNGNRNGNANGNRNGNANGNSNGNGNGRGRGN